jgi:sulfhydrogenase subunit beta (sulfur reductase)
MVTASIPRVSASVVVLKAALQKVFENLRAAGFTLLGPRVRDGAIVLDEIAALDDLPRGWTEDKQPGRYRLVPGREGQYFGFTVGPHSWKQFLHPPRTVLFTARKSDGTWIFEPATPAAPQYAFIGVRPCDLKAIALQDRVLLEGPVPDPHYRARRRQVFLLAANCGAAAATCFCTSMKTGPRATTGFDLALTELPDAFLVDVGSETGSEMLEDTEWEAATAFDLGRAAQALQRAERQQRELRTDDLPRLLYSNLEHPHWDEVAARCLSCGNCTLACPTCFCTTVEDSSDLRGQVAQRTRMWDSCFTADFSQVHGGNTRPTIRSRYRQFLTHKYASWIDQFGTVGCVGCGRCMTWCPVGIDPTQEVKAFRVSAARPK